MLDLLQIENAKALSELSRFEIVREWRKGERLYNLNDVCPNGRFVWERFGKDRAPLLGLEQLNSNNGIYKSKIQFNAFFLMLMLSARDIPDDMRIRIAVDAWHYGKFMRKYFYYKQSYPWSLHYFFDQLKDDYILMLKNDRSQEKRSYAKLFQNGKIRIVTLYQTKVDIIESEIREELCKQICENAKKIVTGDLLQEVDPEKTESTECYKLFFGLNMWGKIESDRKFPNECFIEQSRYDFLNRLMTENAMSQFTY